MLEELARVGGCKDKFSEIKKRWKLLLLRASDEEFSSLPHRWPE